MSLKSGDITLRVGSLHLFFSWEFARQPHILRTGVSDHVCMWLQKGDPDYWGQFWNLEASWPRWSVNVVRVNDGEPLRPVVKIWGIDRLNGEWCILRGAEIDHNPASQV